MSDTSPHRGRERRREVDESDLVVGPPEHAAAGPTAVAVALGRAVDQMGVRRAARALTALNQADGFDCSGCAWPDPDHQHRHTFEFCENGAKAVVDEATRDHIGADFFAEHSVAELAERTDYWLGAQGRITEPLVLRDGDTHYRPIGWEAAYDLIAGTLRSIDPDQAIFYTSGKTSNEAAFLYQTFVRAYGTNNLPDCSNMCHESTSVALAQVTGVGKGSVSLEDVHHARLIVVLGQNPGTNHPRMLSALETAKRNGARIVAINPLREPGLVRFKNPQKVSGMIGRGTELADEYLQIRSGGDLALLQAVGSLLLEWNAVDADFVATHTAGFEEYAAARSEVDWPAVIAATGLTREQVHTLARMLRDSDATVFCWAMGITQQPDAVATIAEIANLAFLQGNIGRPGAGLCPVRGHSNVQGDRTMGIWEDPPPVFRERMEAEFGFPVPEGAGHGTVAAIRALRDGSARFFMALGGNFVGAAPDTDVTAAAMRNADLTVQVSTKLNRSHVNPGRQALILPALTRSERDLTGGVRQRVTVEDSMSSVHASAGPLEPASEHLRSEVDIVCSIAEATLRGRHGIDWAGFRSDYRRVREVIGRVVPGCEGYAENVDRPGGFVLPHPPRDSRTFPNAVGKAVFTVSPLTVRELGEGMLILQTLRSHDQFNTQIYGLSDRYRGVAGGRRVVFVGPADLAALGLQDGQLVDLESEWDDGVTRKVAGFRVVAYDQPRGCAAAYYPETNPLVPLEHVAATSHQPAYKAVPVRLIPATAGRAARSR